MPLPLPAEGATGWATQLNAAINEKLTIADAASTYATKGENWIRTAGPTATATSYGAVGNGSTNDTAALQSGIDALSAAGGGTLILDKKAYCFGGLILKSNVLLTSMANGVKWAGGGAAVSVVAPSGFTGWIIDSPSTNIKAAGVSGLTLNGGIVNSSSPNRGGIRIQNGTWCTVEDNGVAAMSLGAIKVSGTACRVANNGLQNFWQFRNGTGVITSDEGVLHMLGTDHWIENNQCNGGMALSDTVDTTNFYKSGMLLETQATWVFGGNGEFSECGVKLKSNTTNLVGVRGDTNPGAGVRVEAGSYSNQFINLITLANSMSVDAAVDNIYVAGYANHFQNIYVGPDWTGGGKRSRYGIYDALNTTGYTGRDHQVLRNRYTDINMSEASVAYDVIGALSSTRLFRIRSGGAGDPSQRPPSRFTAGESWYDTVNNRITFSTGRNWVDSSNTIVGNLFTARAAYFNQFDTIWDVHNSTSTRALGPGNFAWPRSSVLEVTATSTGASNGYAAVIMNSSWAATVTAGQQYQFSIEASGVQGKAGNNVSVDIYWFNGSATFLSQVTALSSQSIQAYPLKQTTLLSGAITAPVNSVFALPVVRFTCTALAAGDKFRLCAPTLTLGTTATGMQET